MRPFKGLILGPLTAGALVAALIAAPASGATVLPLWNIQAIAAPSTFQTSETVGTTTSDEYLLVISNLGETASSKTITVTDSLPAGVTTTETPVSPTSGVTCSTGAGQVEVTCTTTSSISGSEVASPSSLQIVIPVTVSSGVSGTVSNSASVSGGGAPNPASVSNSNPVNTPASSAFGLSYFNASVLGTEGMPFAQAGGHPYAVTVNFGFDTEIQPSHAGDAGKLPTEEEGAFPAGEDPPREIAVDLPLGLVGNPLAAPRCTVAKVGSKECPPDTQVGWIELNLGALGKGAGPSVGYLPLFNVQHEPGRPGEFAFNILLKVVVVLYGTVVRTPLGNVVRVVTPVPKSSVEGVSITFFGAPGSMFAPSEYAKELHGEEVPFLEDSTQCGASEAQRTITMHVDSWAHPGALNPDGTPDFSDPNWKQVSAVLPAMEGCDLLDFNPSSFELAPGGLLSASPVTAEGGTTQADEPSAFEGRLKIPQVESFSSPSTPEVKNVTVTLPEGLSVSPSAAGGLEGCSEEQLDPASGEPGKCSSGSQLGTVEVETPLLEKPLQGHVYLAEPKCGEENQAPCNEAEAEEGKLFGLDMELDGEAVIKLPGRVEAGGYGAYSATHGLKPGQLRAVFEDDPQLPFGELRFKFKEGPRTPLANPQTCGNYTTSSVLEPWSAPYSANVTSESSFNVDWDGKGGACPSTLPFAPGFTAGTESSAAGAFSPLVVRFQRKDEEQDLSGISVHMPAGVLGDLSGIPLCGEAQANAGTCGEASQIGTTSAAVGPGEDPYWITGGRVYLTEGYKGAPFGLSIVVPADAGPFHLGNVVVRASIAVNPLTSELTVTSNPLPQVVYGVPLRLRTVEVDVDRKDFIFNATNCATQKIEATLTGLDGFNATSGSTSVASYQYAANGCGSLSFKPSFTASTQGKTSRRYGASLNVKVTYPTGSVQAGIKRVKVELPKALPSELSTLQKACPEAAFEANPASCPAESVVGTAVVHTPVLSEPLKGPAYFVSRGTKWPELILVLQGEGVTIVLQGETFIEKGITSSTFGAVPDAPFSSFELKLPESEHSALAAPGGKLCQKQLVMPTTIDAQNGAVVQQNTKIKVTGCATARKLSKAQKLAKALAACKKKPKHARAACRSSARKRYGTRGKATKHGKARKARGSGVNR